jgi:hypothetical protein
MAPAPGWPIARHRLWNCPTAAFEILALSMMSREERFAIASIS